MSGIYSICFICTETWPPGTVWSGTSRWWRSRTLGCPVRRKNTRCPMDSNRSPSSGPPPRLCCMVRETKKIRLIKIWGVSPWFLIGCFVYSYFMVHLRQQFFFYNYSPNYIQWDACFNLMTWHCNYYQLTALYMIWA